MRQQSEIIALEENEPLKTENVENMIEEWVDTETAFEVAETDEEDVAIIEEDMANDIFTEDPIVEPTSNTTEKLFHCPNCQRSFKRHDRLKEHLNLHTNTFYKCGIDGCTKEYWNKQSFFSHQETHKNYTTKCTVCNKEFATRAAFRSHIKQVHAESLKEHRCEFCGKCFKNHKMLYCHKQIHIRDKTHECPICLKKFISNAKLNRHKLQVHVESKAYQCLSCSYSTASRSNFVRHQNKHANLVDDDDVFET